MPRFELSYSISFTVEADTSELACQAVDDDLYAALHDIGHCGRVESVIITQADDPVS